MKIVGWCSVWMLLMSWSVSAERLYDDFDQYSSGVITNQTGWDITKFLAITNALPAQINSDQPLSIPNNLELPWALSQAGKTNCIAVNTNFSYIYHGSNNPVICVSMMLYLDNANQNLLFMLNNENNQSFGVYTDSGSGHLHMNGTDTGHAVATGRYANLSFWFNMSNFHYALSYDYNNIIPWSEDSASSITQFNQFVVGRLMESNQTAGAVYIDNVSIKTFPESTWGWWRFDTPESSFLLDELAYFGATNVISLGSSWTPHTFSDPIYCDGEDIRNPYALRRAVSELSSTLVKTPLMSNWTYEAIVHMKPDGSNLQLIQWGTGFGYNTTSSYISFSWNGAGRLAALLRDAEQTTDYYNYIANLHPLDDSNHWYHIAFVKSGGNLDTYVNYLHVSTTVLNGYANGAYYFDTNSSLRIGMSLNSGNLTTTNRIFDEVRFSTRALESHEFIQAAQPIITTIPTNIFSSSSQTYSIMTISGKTYEVRKNHDLMDHSSWETKNTFVATNHYTDVTTAGLTGSLYYIQMIRQ